MCLGQIYSHFPPVEQDGKILDTLIVCVDRQSGWIVAVAERKVGLSGAKVALAMVQHQWRPFGVPSVITSEQLSQFVDSWTWPGQWLGHMLSVYCTCVTFSRHPKGYDK